MSKITINKVEMAVVQYEGQRVVTFAMIDQVHERTEGTARRNFTEHKARLIEGEDFYLIDFAQKDEFRSFGIEVPPRGLTVLTESGYLMLVKSFTDDLAWEVQRKLVNGYFRQPSASDQSAIPQTLPEALRLAADLAEQKQVAEAERDEAIRTKAMIGSKREATAMARVAAANRLSERLQHELGRNTRHATVIAVQNALGIVYPRTVYVGLRKWCKQHGVSPVEVVDERYGMVKTWPAGAWRDVEGVDLAELFGNDMLPMVAASAAKVLPFGGAR